MGSEELEGGRNEVIVVRSCVVHGTMSSLERRERFEQEMKMEKSCGPGSVVYGTLLLSPWKRLTATLWRVIYV